MIKKNKQEGLFETIDSMRDKYLLAKDEEEIVYKKMNEEIETEVEKIKLSYQEKLNISKNTHKHLKDELQNQEKLIKSYSTFDSEMIGNIIAQLVSIFEGEVYSFQKATHETYKYESTPYGSESFRTTKKMLMIVQGNNKYSSYYDYNENNNVILRLIAAGQGFVLSESEFDYDKKITFFKSTTENFLVMNCHKFPYVKDFINLVIQYRYENHLENITKNELLNIFNQFILSKQEIIEERYIQRAIEKQEQLICQLTQEKELKEFEDMLKNGIPSKYNNNLIDRLQENANSNTKFDNLMREFEILYEWEKNKAKITGFEPLISSENIFIAKINFESSIDYFDNSDPDPHFWGDCHINLVDDGLIGIVDISNKNLLDCTINSFLPYKMYKVDRINDKYLRVLYLPNIGEYKHKPINIYSWVISLFDSNKDIEDCSDKNTSYQTKWNCIEESEKMLVHLKEIELISNLNENQLKLYRKRKK